MMKIFLNNNIYTNKYYNAPLKSKHTPNFTGSDLNSSDTFEKKEYMDEAFLKKINIEKSHCSQTVKNAIREKFICKMYITGLLPDEYNTLKTLPNASEIYRKKIIGDKFSPEGQKMLDKILQDSGINTTEDLTELRTRAKYIEAEHGNTELYETALIELFKEVPKKEDMSNYLEILCELNDCNKYGSSKTDIQSSIDFLKRLGIKNSEEFYRTFSHLKEYFDDFTTEEGKISCFKFVFNDYPYKKQILDEAVMNVPTKKINPDRLYAKNAGIIDYIFKYANTYTFNDLSATIMFISSKEQPNREAKEAIDKIASPEDYKSQIELYNLLQEENLSIHELNAIYRQTKPDDDKDLFNIIIKRSETISKLIDNNMDYAEAKEYYLKFFQIINVVQKNYDSSQEIDLLSEVLKITKNFNIKNSEDFISFYQKFTTNNAKTKKGKKQSNNIKPQEKDIINFIELMSFANPEIIEKYKKDKNYQLKKELETRQKTFENNKIKIEKEIQNNNATILCHSAFNIFVNYYDIFKSSKNAKDFTDRVIKLRIEENKEDKSIKSLYDSLLYIFNDEESLNEFINKCDIRLEDPNHAHTKRCLRIINALFKDKNPDEMRILASKLTENNFLKNSKQNLDKFTSKKSDDEIKTLFEIILDNNFDEISDITTRINKYNGKNKKIDKFLESYKNSNLPLDDFIKRLEQIQKKLDNSGINITINNDNISKIETDFIKEGTLSNDNIINLAKEILNPNREGNFIQGLSQSTVKTLREYSAKDIAKEIYKGQMNKYQESYPNIIKYLDLNNIEIENLSPKLKDKAIDFIESMIDQNFVNFINSSEWTKLDDDGENMINISLHAKMRLIERFLLPNNEITELFSDEAIKESRKIIQNIYTDSPQKVTKSNTKDDTFVSQFIQNGKNCIAVFTQEGELITLALKNS